MVQSGLYCFFLQDFPRKKTLSILFLFARFSKKKNFFYPKKDEENNERKDIVLGKGRMIKLKEEGEGGGRGFHSLVYYYRLI